MAGHTNNLIYVLADVITFFMKYHSYFGITLMLTKYPNHSKKLLQSTMELFQIATAYVITKCDRYNKVRWLLQIATVQPF